MLNTLDINTERGRIAAKQQAKAIEVLEQRTGMRFVTTDDRDSALVDAFAYDQQNRMVAVCEVKSRSMTLRQLKDWRNEWLITYEKIRHGCDMAKTLRVPFIGVLYLTPDDLVLTIIISDKSGNLMQPTRIERTETQATTNGGKIIRSNAYINMNAATKYA